MAGGDGTVAAAAAVADRHHLPLVLVPAGTLNDFARDVGVYDLQEAVDASGAGEAVAVDLGLVQAHPGLGADPYSDEVTRTRYFLNTASIGSYPELVRLRERWQPRWGKWPAFVAALYTVLRRSERIDVKIDGEWRTVWFLFVGNGPYHPRGMVPAWRPTLDSGLLDVRWLRADVRFSRFRRARRARCRGLWAQPGLRPARGRPPRRRAAPPRDPRHRRRGRGGGRALHLPRRRPPDPGLPPR